MTQKWVWVSLAVASMWIAVLFTAVFAPSLTATSAGGDTTSVPVATFVVALFAFIATLVVAGIGYRERPRDQLDVERERLERLDLEARIAELEKRLGSQNAAHGRARSLIGR